MAVRTRGLTPQQRCWRWDHVDPPPMLRLEPGQRPQSAKIRHRDAEYRILHSFLLERICEKTLFFCFIFAAGAWLCRGSGPSPLFKPDYNARSVAVSSCQVSFRWDTNGWGALGMWWCRPTWAEHVCRPPWPGGAGCRSGCAPDPARKCPITAQEACREEAL